MQSQRSQFVGMETLLSQLADGSFTSKSRDGARLGNIAMRWSVLSARTPTDGGEKGAHSLGLG
jgi:hypothetical protein